MLKCTFQQCSNCKTNGKIGNFNLFTFSIVVLDEKAAISSLLRVFLTCRLGGLLAILEM